MTGTTYKQAKRLFRAGVDVKTSDFFNDGGNVFQANILSIKDEYLRRQVYPVWSMEALYSILPDIIHSDSDGKDYIKEIVVDDVWYSNYEKVGDLYKVSYMHKEYEGDLIENLVSMIIWYQEGAKQDYGPSEEFSWVKDC